ncbi:hypothetical protein GOODEAATRI_005741 [Goodea atripinnis]|uniref:RHD domain-containing protein n=1 Tax=Goodea atripinnis TaxID=208336 RepID=A0ABV0MQT7_9TELE
MAESVYDLLPKELQLQPSSTQTDPPTMSQKSGGEAGPPPSATLASGEISTQPMKTMIWDQKFPLRQGVSAYKMVCSSLLHRSEACLFCLHGYAHPSASSSLAMGLSSSGLSTSSSDHLTVSQHLHSAVGDGAGASEMQGMEAAGSAPSRGNGGVNPTGGDVGTGVLSGLGVQQLQNTPSKRRPVLSISPPPEDLFDDSQMSCQEEPTLSTAPCPDSEHSSSMWADDSGSNFSLISSISYNDNTEVPRKSRKRTPRQRPGPKPAPLENSMDVFDADSAKGPHFVLSQLGTDKTSAIASSLDSGTAAKGGSLSAQFPQRSDGKELKILVQPETQHRARYLTEGSRGSVKDRTQQGFPTVFVANDAGRVKPHGFYQACRVTGRNTTACTEVDIDGTTVIEIPLEPSNDMTLAVDCVGILKLRNADVEARIGVAGSKKKSTRARLAFRVNIPQPDGSPSPDPLISVQQTLELNSGPHSGGETFESPMPLQPEDVELPQAPPVFASLESLTTIQKQEISSTTSFPVPGDTTIPPVTPEVPQQFLRDPQESLSPESSDNSGTIVVVAMPPMATPAQPQPQQSQVTLFPQEGVAQLERAVRELQAGGTTTLEQVLEVAVAQQQLNSPQIHSSTQAQQPVSLLQQAGELLTIQTSFPTQPPSHTSPPQQLFQSPQPLAETQSSQQQVQAALLQNTLKVLSGGGLSSDQQSTGSTIFLSTNQQQQQPQLAFISSMETSSSQPQPVSMFQNQPPTQLSQLQSQNTPMEQQQSPQQNPQQPQQLPMGQQASLFQNITNHSQANAVPQNQLSQSQQTGLLLCTTDLNSQAILFSTPTQAAPPIGSLSVGIPQPDTAEPMSFQVQSSSESNSTPTANQQQSLFQEQQPMQVTPSPRQVPSSQSMKLFIPQTSLSGLQGTIGSQELNNESAAPAATIFVVQGGVGVVASPGQQPPEQLFQTTVGGNVASQGQPNLFVFGIQNVFVECTEGDFKEHTMLWKNRGKVNASQSHTNTESQPVTLLS